MLTETGAPKVRLVVPKALYFGPENISTVEALRECRYLGESSVPLTSGGWSYAPVALFWQAVPPPQFSDQHVFGLYRQADEGGQVYIRGVNGFDCVVDGLYVPELNIIYYSRYRHDYYAPSANLPAIDGGRDYTRHSFGEGLPASHVVRIDLINRVFHQSDISDDTIPTKVPYAFDYSRTDLL